MNPCEKSRALSQARGYLGELDYLENELKQELESYDHR